VVFTRKATTSLVLLVHITKGICYATCGNLYSACHYPPLISPLIKYRYHGMAHPKVVGGEWPPLWRVAMNILNNQSQTTDKGWSSSLGVGRSVNNSSL